VAVLKPLALAGLPGRPCLWCKKKRPCAMVRRASGGKVYGFSGKVKGGEERLAKFRQAKTPALGKST